MPRGSPARPRRLRSVANACWRGLRSRHDLEQLARSLAAMPAGQAALRREEARQLLAELIEAQDRYEELIARLQALISDSGCSPNLRR